MKTNANFSGVIAPVVTPWGEDGAPDLDRFV
jgi:dihydrodipicolinate synthase/N-acetylneuraminate lyase